MRAYTSICVFLLACLAPSTGGSEEADPLRCWDIAYRSPCAQSPDYAAALGELRRGILFGVSDCDLYYRMGYCYEKLGKADMAKRSFGMALTSRDECPSDIIYYAHLHAGMLDFEGGDLGDALEHFKKAAAIKPDRWVARNNLAVLERELGRKEGGADGRARAVDGNPVWNRNRAIIRGEEGLTDEALAECGGAVSRGCKKDFIRYTRAEVLNSSGRHAGAAGEYLACAGGGDPASYLRVAEIALLEGRYGRFIISLQKALDVDHGAGFPPAVSARLGAARLPLLEAQGGSVHRDQDEIKEERADLIEAISGDDADAGAHCGLARLYEYNGEGQRYGDGFHIGRVFSHYAAALSIDPDHARSHLGLGRLYHLAGDGKSALREYSAAVKADSRLSRAYFNKGLIYASRNMAEDALRSFREVLRYEPELAQAHYRAALALTRLGRYGEAVEEYEKTLALNPGDCRCYFNMGRIYADYLGDKEKAAEYFELCRRSRPEPMS